MSTLSEAQREVLGLIAAGQPTQFVGHPVATYSDMIHRSHMTPALLTHVLGTLMSRTLVWMPTPTLYSLTTAGEEARA